MRRFLAAIFIGFLPFYASVAVANTKTIEIIDLDVDTTSGGQTTVITEQRVVGAVSEMSALDLEKNRLKAEKIVNDALLTLVKAQGQAFYPDMKQRLGQARAVLIFPSIIKASIFFGVGGGEGVLLVRDDNGNWSNPSFYKTVQGGWGIQFGASLNSIITVVETQKSLDTLLKSRFKLGANMNAAVGNVGDGQGYSVTGKIRSYSINQGAAIGVAVDGESISPVVELNEAYYNASGANTQTIAFDRVFENPNADGLIQKLSGYTFTYQ